VTRETVDLIVLGVAICGLVGNLYTRIRLTRARLALKKSQDELNAEKLDNTYALRSLEVVKRYPLLFGDLAKVRPIIKE
jgi:hypothetical protein